MKAELNQIISGLSSTLNMLELIRRNACQMEELFLFKPCVPLSWEDFYNLLPAHMSSEGSNKREREEAVMMKWIGVLQLIDGTSVCTRTDM